MKAKIKLKSPKKLCLNFNLPEEKIDAEIHLNAQELLDAIEDFSNWLRTKRKYGDKNSLTIDEIYEGWNEATDEINHLIFSRP